MNLEHKKILVIGAGLSGIAAVELLEQNKAICILYEGNQERKPEDIKASLPLTCHAEILIGTIPDSAFGEIYAAVVSPGVPMDSEPVKTLVQRQIPVWGEIELAYRYSRGCLAAITGTNGKTTTTTLVGDILRSWFESVFVVGNIGIPYTRIAQETKDNSVIAAEISSFQLESIDSFHPRVSAVLNITPDHLDRHHTMEAYIAAKLAITKNQGPEDTCVLNYEDSVLREAAEKLHCRTVFFSGSHPVEQGVYMDREGFIQVNLDQIRERVCHTSELLLPGLHNYENIMAAIAVGIRMGVPLEQIRSTIRSFKAVEHRIEYVACKNGVKYYNDSKGTNPDAAIKGIEAMVTPTLLIGGGYDKNSDYQEWIRAFNGKVKRLVLIGQTREKIRDAALNCGFTDITLAETLPEAVAVCSELAEMGDSVLLSPACASWGMFRNYEERGEQFKALVNAMED